MTFVQRLISTGLSIWLAVSLAFIALRVLPGNALDERLAQSSAPEAAISARRAALGLDDPLLTQYALYWSRAASGDLGVSLLNGLPVTEIIDQGFSYTLQLSISALLVAVSLGVGLGLCAAQRLGWGLSTLAQALINLALGTPVYVTAMLLIYIFTLTLDWLPSSGADSAAHLILPVAALGFHSAGGIAQVVQTAVHETLHADFVRFARGKGLRERIILRRHVLRVGLLPLITVVALQAGFLLSGTVITESIFARPGIGRIALNATLQRDYPVVQGVVALAAAVYAGLNLLADVLYRLADPRLIDVS